MIVGWVLKYLRLFSLFFKRLGKKKPFPRFLSTLTHPPLPPPSLLPQIRKLPHIMRRALVPTRVLIQIQLMIILGVPPGTGVQDLGRDGPLGPPLRLGALGDPLRRGGLLGRVREDAAAVLRAGVAALPVLGRGVVHAVEEFEEGGVGELGGVEGHLEGFGVWGGGGGFRRGGWLGRGRNGDLRPVRPEHTAR